MKRLIFLLALLFPFPANAITVSDCSFSNPGSSRIFIWNHSQSDCAILNTGLGLSIGSTLDLTVSGLSAPASFGSGDKLYTFEGGVVKVVDYDDLPGAGGGVSSISISTANGFAGSSSGGATPALTLETTVTGILVGDGTGIDAAIAADFPTLNQSTTGNAATATALSANPANCSAGNYPLGIAANGDVESCTAAATQYTDEMAQDAVGGMVNTSLTYTDGTPSLALTSRTIGNVAFDGTANIVPQTIQVVDAAGDTTTFVMLAGGATGDLQPLTDAGFPYNATTNVATVGVSGAVNGVTLTTGGSATDFLNAQGNYVAGSGSGDVTGPASSVDNAIARFDGTTGKIIQDYTSGAPTVGDTGIAAFNNNVTVAGTQTITSNSATALAVGPNGATNPALTVAANTGSMDNGLTVTGGTASVALDATGNDAAVNISLTSKGTGSATVDAAGAGNLLLRNNATTVLQSTAGRTFTIGPLNTNGTASTVRLSYTGVANTGLTAGTNFVQTHINQAQTNQHASNTDYALQQDFMVSGMTHSFASAGGDIVDAYAGYFVQGAAGTNATIANIWALGTTGNVKINGAEGADASLALDADEGDDSGDTWFIKSLAANALSVLNEATEVFNLTTTGSLQIDGAITPNTGVTLIEGATVKLDAAGSADGAYSGTTIAGTAGYTQAFGDLVYLDPTDSRWEAMDANAASGADGDARGTIGMVVVAGTDGTACTILTYGTIRADANFASFTINAPIYASETAGDVTATAPSTASAVVRVVGAAHTADEILFDPDRAWVEIAP